MSKRRSEKAKTDKSSYKEELEKKERLKNLHKNISHHLSEEYLYLSEKKDNLENEMTRLKMEIDKRDRILFPSIEKEDKRKYFSPLNLKDISVNREDEKKKELKSTLKSIQEDIYKVESQIEEIMKLLRELDILL